MNWCSNQERCGGCYYQEIPYEEELKIKEEEIRSLFAPLVMGDFPFEGIISSPKKEAYRNKMEFSFGDQEKDGPLCLGLHQKRSFFNILNTEDCRLPHPDMGKILLATREYFLDKGVGYFHKKRHEGYLRHLLIRRGEKTGEILVSLVHNLFAEKSFSEQDILQSLAVKNVRQESEENCVTETGGEAESIQLIFDLYSGNGTITQLMSEVAKEAYGVEIIEEAVESAKENAKENGIENCRFIAGDVLKVLEQNKAAMNQSGDIAEGNSANKEENGNILPRPDFIVVDPPRDGMHKRALDLIIRYGVNRLIYVACKPKSLARDLEPLQAAGYRVKRLCAVDMFPRTNNVEAVCLLEKQL